MLLRLLLGVLVAVALVAALELALRASGLAPAPRLMTLEAGSKPDTLRFRAWRLFTATPPTSPDFAATKPAGALRIAILGESAAAGFPYLGSSTPARWLALRLSKVLPGRTIEVVDAAVAGIGSDWMKDAAEQLAPRGVDLAIVYAGNNELLKPMLVRAGEERDPPLRARVGKLAIARLVRRLQGPTESAEPQLPPPFVDSNELLDDRHLGDLKDFALQRFEDNLAAAGRALHAAGAQVLMVRPVANLESAPLGSILRADLADASKRRCRELLAEAAKAQAAGQPARAKEQLEQLCAIDGCVALARYRLGRLLATAGDADGARREWTIALDCDERPSRVNALGAARIRSAATATGAAFLDAQAEFAKLGGPPAALLVDHCHLSIEGQYRLVSLWIATLAERGMIAPRDQWRLDADVTFEQGVAALGLNVADALLSEVQLGFTSLLASREEPQARDEHLATARARFQDVLDRYPGQPRARCGMAFVRVASGDVDGALAEFDAVAKEAPAALREMESAASSWKALAQILGDRGLVLANGRVARKTP